MATGYGREMSCTDSLRSARFVSGTKALGEACIRRLTITRGTLWFGSPEDQDYGENLNEGIGQLGLAEYAATIPGRVETELAKDDRVATVKVTTSVDETTGTIETKVKITGHDMSGSFEFTLAVSAVSVELLSQKG